MRDAHSRKAVEFAEAHANAGVYRPRNRRAVWKVAHLALEKAITFARWSMDSDEYRVRKISESTAHAAQRLVEEDAWAAAVSVCDAAASAVGHSLLGVDTNAPSSGFDHYMDARDLEYAKQCELLRDIIGNPLRPVAIHSGWLTETVTKIAAAAFGDWKMPEGTLDSDCLAVLADALEDAGCTEAVILDHLRGPGPHYRGCFVIDALLGYS
jgi:hypothetical protein